MVFNYLLKIIKYKKNDKIQIKEKFNLFICILYKLVYLKNSDNNI